MSFYARWFVQVGVVLVIVMALGLTQPSSGVAAAVGLVWIVWSIYLLAQLVGHLTRRERVPNQAGVRDDVAGEGERHAGT
jgi:hypothetical protein